MAFPAAAVANAFLDIGKASGQPIDPMKMQKLVYFAHGWHLGLGDGQLIEEPVEAWDYGPVVYPLYQELKPYGSSPITAPLKGLLFSRSSLAPYVHDRGELAFLDRIWSVYGHLSAVELSARTHQPGTPWETIRKRNPESRRAVIPDETMRTYFQELAKLNAAKRAKP